MRPSSVCSKSTCTLRTPSTLWAARSTRRSTARREIATRPNSASVTTASRRRASPPAPMSSAPRPIPSAMSPVPHSCRRHEARRKSRGRISHAPGTHPAAAASKTTPTTALMSPASRAKRRCNQAIIAPHFQHRRRRHPVTSMRLLRPPGGIAVRLLRRGRLREMNPLDVNVHLDDLQSRHAFDSTFHIFLNFPRHFGNADAEIHHDVKVHRRPGLVHLHFDALEEALAPEHFRNAAADAAAHARDPFDLRRGQASDNAHHFVRDPDFPQLLALLGLFPFLFPVGTGLQLGIDGNGNAVAVLMQLHPSIPPLRWRPAGPSIFVPPRSEWTSPPAET